MLVNQGAQPARISRWPRELFSQPLCTHRAIAPTEVEGRWRPPRAAAIELRAGRALTDAEWAAARARLLEFAGILRDWDRKTTASRTR